MPSTPLSSSVSTDCGSTCAGATPTVTTASAVMPSWILPSPFGIEVSAGRERIADRARDVRLDGRPGKFKLSLLEAGLGLGQTRLSGEGGVGSREALLHQRLVGVIGGLSLVDGGLSLVGRQLTSALVESAQH